MNFSSQVKPMLFAIALVWLGGPMGDVSSASPVVVDDKGALEALEERVKASEARARRAEERAKVAEERAKEAERRTIAAEKKIRSLKSVTRKKATSPSKGLDEATKRALRERLTRDLLRDAGRR